MNNNNEFKFDTIDEAILAIRQGEIVIVVDDEDRENEGDFLMAASMVTPDKINFMAKHGRGLICTSLTAQRLEQLDLHPMVSDNTAHLGTAFTVSVDAKKNTTTGISAFDRAETIRAMLDPATMPSDLARPGHIFPLRAQDGGVLRRAGHTEAVVDLARMAGLYPAGILCEIMDEDGSMARVPRLMEVAKKFNLKIITIKDLIFYRHHKEKLVQLISTADLPTRYGDFKIHVFESKINAYHHVALVKGKIKPDEATMVRVHSQCLTGDLFHSLRCDCGDQLDLALKMINKAEKGILLYMRQEGRGIGLANKIKAYHLQDQGKDTVEANEALGFKADLRDYGVGAQILRELGVQKITLITNNPRKVIGLKGYGLEIVDRIPIEIEPNETNLRYLSTKRDKLGHLILNGQNENVLNKFEEDVKQS